MSPEVYVPMLLILGTFLAGDLLSKLVKYRVDSLIFSIVLLIVFGSVLHVITPSTFEATGFMTIINNFGIPFAIVSFGASVSLSEMKGQYKTFIIGTAAVALIILTGSLIGTPPTDLRTSLYSSVEVAGGGQAGLIMLTKAQQIGDTKMVGLMLLLMNMQILVGYPACVYSLRAGMKKHLMAGDMMEIASGALAKKRSGAEEHKGMNFRIPDDVKSSFYYVFVVFTLICLLSFYVGQWTRISHYVWEIILGFAAVQVGIIPKDALNKAGAGGMIFGLMYPVICEAFVELSWEEILGMLPIVALFFAIGVAGCAACGAIFSRVFKKNFFETWAVALGCMVGFPPSLLVAKAAAADLKTNMDLDDETYEAMVAYYQPQIVISGVVTISVETGIIAGILVSLI